MADDRLSGNLILRLFDTLKDTNRENTRAIESLSNSIAELIVINNEKSTLIQPAIKSIYSIKNRVTIMIACVCIAFTLMVISYYFVSSSVENMVKKSIESTEHHHGENTISSKDLLKRTDELRKKIEINKFDSSYY